MLCKDAEELIKNYKLGSITADNFLLLIQHTEECPKCKALFDAVENSTSKENTGNFFRTLFKSFKKFDNMIKEKRKQKKIYTKKSFYFFLIILMLALATGALYKFLSFNFGNIYIVLSAFLTLSSIAAFFMLISIEE